MVKKYLDIHIKNTNNSFFINDLANIKSYFCTKHINTYM